MAVEKNHRKGANQAKIRPLLLQQNVTCIAHNNTANARPPHPV